jgi:hypothetical protein
MLIVFLICFLCGAVLGQRYKVLALVPVLAMAIPVAAISLHADTIWKILGVALATATTVEIGYVTGLGIRYLMVAVRVRVKAGPFAAATSPRRVAN